MGPIDSSVESYRFIESPRFTFLQKSKGKVFYGQKPPSGESTTTECGVNFQLLLVITEVAQWGTPSCSEPQPATDNGIRVARSNWLVVPPTLMGSTPWTPRASYKLVQPQREPNVQPQHARQPPHLCGYSGYNVPCTRGIMYPVLRVQCALYSRYNIIKLL